MTRLRNLTGSLTVKSPHGQCFYKLDAAQLDEWFSTRGLVARIRRFAFDWRETRPYLAGASAAVKGTTFRLRREAALLVWGKANRPVQLVARVEPVGRHTPSAGVMTVTTPGGKTTELKPNVEPQQLVCPFKRWVCRLCSGRRVVTCSSPWYQSNDCHPERSEGTRLRPSSNRQRVDSPARVRKSG